MTIKSAIIVFPGINRERDMARTLRLISGHEPAAVWHADPELPAGTDLVVIPGGFSYGDYLRCGAMAAHSPIMREIKAAAARGTPVLGICNGFQILVEAGLLPAALIRNRTLKFSCRDVHLRTETTNSPFTCAAHKGEILRMPIAHGEGCYFAEDHTLDELEAEDRVAFRYLDNPNGSVRDIAGILNPERNVMGLMPHPERATEPLMGSTDGLVVFESMLRLGQASRSALAPAVKR